MINSTRGVPRDIPKGSRVTIGETISSVDISGDTGSISAVTNETGKLMTGPL